MKIGVISDTHISDRTKSLPQKILEDFKNVDLIIHAGDLVDISVIDKLKNVCDNVKAVWGNMDSGEIKKKLPEKEILSLGKYKIGIMHGYGAPDTLINLLSNVFKDDNVNMVIFGHSHNSLNKKIGNILFFNPGSPTDNIFSRNNSYGIIEINDRIEAKIINL